jgi:2-octaprenyl-6-methoxyphenol hydroxylase
MKKQKICIIGDGLTGLTTALSLKNLNINVDLFYKNNNKKAKIDKRTTAISESNFHFLSNQLKIKKQYFWPCKNIDLYYEKNLDLLNFFSFDQQKKNLLYMFENNKIKKFLFKQLKESKNVKFINKKINNINHDKSSIKYNNAIKNYDLIILCMGNCSKYYDDITNNRLIKKNYNETSITCTVKNNLNIKNSSQYFLKEGPLAILPFKKNIFSLVWSLKNKFYLKNSKNLNNLILGKLKHIYGNKIKLKLSSVQSFPISLVLYSKYFKKNSLILGEGIHKVHPMAGQGFNLVLRDIKKLYEIVEKNLEVGLLIKDSLILKEFYYARKPENILMSLGIDLTNSLFQRNKFMQPLQDFLLKNIKQSKIMKKFSEKVSNTGLY